jgi:hypothetical protein
VTIVVFREFLAALEGTEIEITNSNYTGLSFLAQEFAFDALCQRLDAFACWSSKSMDGRGIRSGPTKAMTAFFVCSLLSAVVQVFRTRLRTSVPALITIAVRPLVSIMMPTYNKGPYIRRAVLSALHQTIQHFELVIGDDCSNDETSDVLAPFISSDNRVRCFRNPTRLYTNVNRIKVLNATNAPFLLSLDSDDELTNRTAEVDLASQRLWNADMVRHVAVMGHNHRVWRWGLSRLHGANNETLVRAFSNRKFAWNLWLYLIRRSLYIHAVAFLGEEVRQMQIAYSEDHLHLAAICRFVRVFVTVDYCGYVYYVNIPRNSVSQEKDAKAKFGLTSELIKKMNQKVITAGDHPD